MRDLKAFKQPLPRRIYYATKASNLAVCFLGLSIRWGEDYYNKSAELGLLASAFDLVSDGLRFDRDAFDRFTELTRTVLGSAVCEILFDVMKKKERGSLRQDGLDRGIAAFRVVIEHLDAAEAWTSDSEVERVGILLQVVDDVLDHKKDLKTDHLNFLRHQGAPDRLNELLGWDHEQQFRSSCYPWVLFRAINRSKVIAAQLAVT